MTLVRSIAFNVAFYAWTVSMVVLYLPALLLPRGITVRGQRRWTVGVNWLMRHLAGIDVEVRGRGNLPPGAVIVAAKHQSAWDTLIYHQLLDDPAMVMKQELMYIPVYGWLALKTDMIAVDRKAGAKAMRRLIRDARRARDNGRQITIFPEGTRSAPDSKKPYHAGVAALYADLGIPAVPVAVNSGLFWPRRTFLRRPGTIVLEFLEPIQPGMNRRAFMAELESRIETATRRLVAEARAENSCG